MSAQAPLSKVIYTADGQRVERGYEVFDYYTMKRGTIDTDPDVTGWFNVVHVGGGRALLNGERICSLNHAQRMGWLND